MPSQQFSGQDSAVYVSGAPVSFTNEAMTGSTDSKTFSISDANKNTWDSTYTPTIETSSDGTTWAPATGYSVVSLLGRVVFTAAQTGLQVRASGKYLPLTQVADATSWDLSIDVNMKETTRFRNDWKTQVPLIKSGSAKFSRWWVDPYFTSTVMASELVVALYIDEANTYGYKATATVQSAAPKSGAEDLVTEDVSLDLHEVAPL